MPTVEDEIRGIADDLRRYGIRSGLFCVKAGLANSTWCRWKSGKAKPQASSLIDAKVALGELIEAARKGNLP